MKEFNKIFEHLAYRHSYMKVFDDFLQASICALSLGRMEKEYANTMKAYTPDEIKMFGHMFAELINEQEKVTLADGSWKDLLGILFEEHNGKFGRDAAGQFFTPPELCDLMAQLTNNNYDDGESVQDPACGSGRCLIGICRQKPSNRLKYFFTGMDVDNRCVKMCTLNFFLHGMKGVVIHMDSLSLKIWGGYRIFLPETGMGIRPLNVSECMEFLFTKEEEPVEILQPKILIPDILKTKPVIKNVNTEKAKQLTLF